MAGLAGGDDKARGVGIAQIIDAAKAAAMRARERMFGIM